MRSGGTFGWWRIRYFDGTLFDDDLCRTFRTIWGGRCYRRRSRIGRRSIRRFSVRCLSASSTKQAGAARRTLHQRKRHHAHRRAGVDGAAAPPMGRCAPPGRPPPAPTIQPTNHRRLPTPRRLRGRNCRHARARSGVRLRQLLYVALRQLLDLQKQVIAFAARRELPEIALTVSPEQLYGIGSTYAPELAQVTVWIGYLQWRHETALARWTTRFCAAAQYRAPRRHSRLRRRRSAD